MISCISKKRSNIYTSAYIVLYVSAKTIKHWVVICKSVSYNYCWRDKYYFDKTYTIFTNTDINLKYFLQIKISKETLTLL